MVLSPAKTLDYTSPLATSQNTQPLFISKSQQLIDICKKLSPAQIATLMKVSDKIASLNAVRFSQWSSDVNPQNGRQAVLAFKGDVYTGLEAQSMNEDDFEWAQKHLRILSGLYGLLRPLDLMQPYRLEMGSKLENESGAHLYAFWGNIITQALNEALLLQNDHSFDNVLVNLASNEYFKAVKMAQLKGRIITPVFKDWKNGQFKNISFFAKKARGMMTRFIIDGRIKDVEEIKKFDTAGYAFCEKDSTENEWIFKRKVQ